VHDKSIKYGRYQEFDLQLQSRKVTLIWEDDMKTSMILTGVFVSVVLLVVIGASGSPSAYVWPGVERVDDELLSQVYGRGFWGCDSDCLNLQATCPSTVSQTWGAGGCYSDGTGGDCRSGCTGTHQACGNWRWQYIYWQCTNGTANCSTPWWGSYVGWCIENLGCAQQDPALAPLAPACSSVTRPDC
jgi:hypothetical protein